eukprot:NODE_79_length_23048_cov_0.747614.p5 type:complete len:538 gc:universal NODE_79_length_23048_cov_0.747614:7471-5858(-)
MESDDDILFDLGRLVSLINALGSIELNQFNEPTYVLGDSCNEVLQDIKNILKEEELTNQRPTLKWLIDQKFTETDLLPILQDHLNNKKIATSVLELLVPLTWPTHHEEIQIYHKKLFSNEYHMNLVKQLIVKLFSRDFRQRDDKDQQLLRMCMLFLRNLLRIEDPTNIKSDFQIESYHEQLINCFKNCNLFNLILKVCSQLGKMEFKSWNSILLDIMHSLILDVPSLFERSSEFAQLMRKEQILNPKEKLTSAMRYKSRIQLIGVDDEVIKTVSGNLNPDYEDLNKAKLVKYRKKKKFTVGLNQSRNYLSPKGHALIREILVKFIYTGANPLFSTLQEDLESHKQHTSDETRLYYMILVKQVLEFMIYCFKKNRIIYNIDGTDIELNWNLVSHLYSTRFIRYLMSCFQVAADEKEKYSEFTKVADCLAYYSASLKELCSDDEILDLATSIQAKLFYDERLFTIMTQMTRDARNYGYGLIKSCILLNDSIFRALEFYSGINNFIFMKRKQKGTERSVDVSTFENVFTCSFSILRLSPL